MSSTTSSASGKCSKHGNCFCTCSQEMVCPHRDTSRRFMQCRTCAWRNLFEIVQCADSWITERSNVIRLDLRAAQMVVEQTPDENKKMAADYLAKRNEKRHNDLRREIENVYQIQMEHVDDFVKKYGDFTPDESKKWEVWKAEVKAEIERESENKSAAEANNEDEGKIDTEDERETEIDAEAEVEKELQSRLFID